MLIEQVRHHFAIGQMSLEANLKDITQAESLQASLAGGNCVNWLAGHLLASRGGWSRALSGDQTYLSAEAAAPYLQGSAPLTADSACTDIDQLRQGLSSSATDVTARLAALTDGDLSAPVDPARFPFPVENPTLATMLTHLLFHEAYHSGQIGLGRRMVGKTSGMGI